MFNKTAQFIGKNFFIAVFFLFLNSAPQSWADSLTIAAGDDNTRDFVSQAGDNVYAQTSDLTIKLEKRLPEEAEAEWPNSIKVVQDPLESSQDSEDYENEDYENMEDPFAGNEKDIPILSDPLEGYNRWMFGVNETFYEYLFEPVAKGYRDAVHENLRIGIRNIFNNALAPVKLVSSLLQLDFKKSGRVIARTLINTTLGIGGIADVAGEEYQIEDVNEDFDQALGYYGVPTGPYVVLPFFGPSTARNVVGRTVDTLLSPGAMSGASFGANVIISGEENVNAGSFIVDDKKQLEDSALDEYESVRDFYHQFRYGLLKK